MCHRPVLARLCTPSPVNCSSPLQPTCISRLSPPMLHPSVLSKFTWLIRIASYWVRHTFSPVSRVLTALHAGKACFLARSLLDLPDSELMAACLYCHYLLKDVKTRIQHLSAHILFDHSVNIDPLQEPCALCFHPAQICKIYLKKGKGKEGGLAIDCSKSLCPNIVNFKYKIAAELTKSLPCSNIPLICPLCSKTAPAVWRYNFKHHIKETHPSVSPDVDYLRQLWALSSFESNQMHNIWKARRNIPKQRRKKRSYESTATLAILEAHTLEAAIRYVLLKFCLHFYS
jgi:hypothetical protein